MANVINIQTILDGPRNTVIKIVGVLDTSDLATTPLVVPASLAGIDNSGTVKAKRVRVKTLKYNVEDGLALYLNWDATVPVLLEQLTGRGNMCFDNFGGLPNNAAAAGNQGIISISTQGWSAGAVLSFSLVIETIKQQTDGPFLVPDAPTIGTAVAGNGQAAVLWTGPANAGSQPINGFYVYAFDPSGVPLGPPQLATVSPWPYTGLPNGVPVAFKVAARSPVGTGQLSALSNTVTPFAPNDSFNLSGREPGSAIELGTFAFPYRADFKDPNRTSGIIRNLSNTLTMEVVEVATENDTPNATGTWSKLGITDADREATYGTGQLFVRPSADRVKIMTVSVLAGLVTATCANHGLNTGDRIGVDGAASPQRYYNVRNQQVMVMDANTFTFPVNAAAGTPTGTLRFWLDGARFQLETKVSI